MLNLFMKITFHAWHSQRRMKSFKQNEKVMSCNYIMIIVICMLCVWASISISSCIHGNIMKSFQSLSSSWLKRTEPFENDKPHEDNSIVDVYNAQNYTNIDTKFIHGKWILNTRKFLMGLVTLYPYRHILRNEESFAYTCA